MKDGKLSVTIPTTIRIAPDLKDAVEACAESEHLSFNGAVTVALIDYVSDEARRAAVRRYFDEGFSRFEAILNKLSET